MTEQERLAQVKTQIDQFEAAEKMKAAASNDVWREDVRAWNDIHATVIKSLEGAKTKLEATGFKKVTTGKGNATTTGTIGWIQALYPLTNATIKLEVEGVIHTQSDPSTRSLR
ncbi:MAG: hypothetical protein KA791_00455, partial [Flavobacteriales bacterium]|nr:hypothetical protein [Flavobacteriales bacterium]